MAAAPALMVCVLLEAFCPFTDAIRSECQPFQLGYWGAESLKTLRIHSTAPYLPHLRAINNIKRKEGNAAGIVFEPLCDTSDGRVTGIKPMLKKSQCYPVKFTMVAIISEMEFAV